MKKQKKHLPDKAPKRTGKRGIGPKPEDEPEKLPTPADAKKPKQARLPQMEDPKIEELEVAAEAYAEVRDQRMALTPQEKKLKDDLYATMKRLDKKTYHHEGVTIEVVSKEETVRVRIKKNTPED